MSLRIGLVRAAHFSRIHPRLPPSLFVRASHDTSTRLEPFLHPLRYPDEPNAVRRHYLPLVAELQRIKALPSSPALPPLLTRDQLITIIDLLATSGRPPDLECIRAMFSHLPAYFGVAVTPELHSVVIAAMLRQGYVPLAQQWLFKIHELPPHEKPSLDNFHTFLTGCPNHVSDALLRDVVVQRTRRAGVRPTNETFAILVRIIVNNATQAKTAISPDTFATIITDMKLLRLPADPTIISMMVDYYLENGFLVRAENIRNNYVAQFPDIMTPEEQQMDRWHKELAAASRESGVEHSLALFRDLAAKGCPADSATFRAILSTSKTVDDILKVEKALGVQADASEYAVVVNNNVRTRQLLAALVVYEESKKSGIVPVAGLVGPMIRSLSSSDKKPPKVHNADLDTALSLYSDLDAAFPVSPDSSEPAASNHSAHAKGPDMDIYTSLMRGLALCSNIQTAQPIAESLLSEMKSRGITATAGIKTSSLVLEMRGADTLDKAFRRYRQSHHELTESGYLVVLHAFSRLSRNLNHPDLLEYYFQIVDDMRRAGFRITDRVYTDILQQFAEIGRQRKWTWGRDNPAHQTPPPKMFDDLLDAVRRVHNIVSLDKTIHPERIVSNQLMDTYQRLHSFPEAYRVWHELYTSGKYGPIGVSIILDACGYAGQYEVVQHIVSNLMAENYIFNLHNWNTYVECLCRLNQFSEALRVICTFMGTSAQPVKPDASTIAVMLQLADTRILSNHILQHVRRNLPELWAHLPSNASRQSENIEQPLENTKRPP
ncbi:hypothetical protein DFH08DRAFT_844546 [Mycena albidolilacea]|uniref:Pentatricopeptide repeat-containing protein n=1 Tax=Mycena albidolilacea TaxID=1033008 RepID=A0AAD7AKS2_9AGAR|nr:hypothetical protein DFH08DRAFT_844546 [Mycena albidolilacea]